MLNIVIPMAGRGSRFSQKGYSSPKPLIPIHGKPMIELVIKNLKPVGLQRFIFLCLKEHLEQYPLERNLKAWAPGCEIVPVVSVTEGAACTVLLAKNLINSSTPLMIANSDQWVNMTIDDYLSSLTGLDGLIMTMTASDPKWSFIRIGHDNLVTEVVEKKVVSSEATVGIYNFAQGSDFVLAAESMIRKNLRVNNEFYVAPVYNELVTLKKKIGFYNIGLDGEKMFGLGTPEDLENFLRIPLSKKAAGL